MNLLGNGWGSIKISSDEYYVCILTFEGGCSSVNQDLDFIVLPRGTIIDLDGFAMSHVYSGLVRNKSVYFRGKIDGITVWVHLYTALKLTDPINENSFIQLGAVDEKGENVSVSAWKCPNRKWFFNF